MPLKNKFDGAIYKGIAYNSSQQPVGFREDGDAKINFTTKEIELLGNGVQPQYSSDAMIMSYFATNADLYSGTVKAAYINIKNGSSVTVFGNSIYNIDCAMTTSNGSSGRGISVGGYANGSTAVGNDQTQVFPITGQSYNALSYPNLFGNTTIGNGFGVSNGSLDKALCIGTGINATSVNTIRQITVSTLANASLFGSLTVASAGCAAASNGGLNKTIKGYGAATVGATGQTAIEVMSTNIPSNAALSGFNLTASAYAFSASAVSNDTDNRAVFMRTSSNDSNSSAGAGVTGVLEYVGMNNLSNSINFGNITGMTNNSGAIFVQGPLSMSNGIGNVGMFVHRTIQKITINTPANSTTFATLPSGDSGRFASAASNSPQ